MSPIPKEQVAYERMAFLPWIPYHGQPGEMGGHWVVQALVYHKTNKGNHNYHVTLLKVNDMYRGTRMVHPAGREFILAWKPHIKGNLFKEYDPELAQALREHALENPVGKDPLKVKQ